MTKVTNLQVKSFIQDKLKTNEQWAKRALILISDNQTDEEYNMGSTHVLNNMGFTGADAFILTSFAKQLKHKGWLSPKQMSIVHKKITKYWRQLKNVSDNQKLTNMVIAALNK